MDSTKTIDEQRKGLPVYRCRKELLKQLAKRENAIIIGETGCGKTTQIPQFLYKAGFNKGLVIACTQPRRVAAVTVATRVAQEMSTELGALVGYSVRFDDVSSRNTKVKYLTDGMLLRESVIDPLLQQYSYVLLDEAHERTLHTDILFGICKQAQARRYSSSSPLKIIIMSATMDADHFSQFFKCEVLYLEGRTFPVQCFYAQDSQPDYVHSAMVTALQIHKTEELGEDILIFLTGEDEVESMVRTLREVSSILTGAKLTVYPMYAKLPSDLQMRVFGLTPLDSRKCIVATNIAETSVTIQGIKHVIDSGMVKIKSYQPSNGLDMLKVSRISKAQAWQRLGRAGRLSPGVCYRLYTELEFDQFTENSLPEILRSNLASVLLQLCALGVKDVRKFEFMDKPSAETLDKSCEQLEMLGAIIRTSEERHVITEIGRKMAAFPVDPRMSKALLAAHANGCLEEMLTVIAMLSVDTVFTCSRAKEEKFLEVQRKFVHCEGDHLTLLNVYRSFKGSGATKEWCSRNYLNMRNIKYASEIRQQLLGLCAQNGLNPVTSCGQNTSVVRRSLLAGYFMNVAELHLNNQYKLILGGVSANIHPSSVLFQSKPHYLLYNDLMQTSKCYMRNVSVIEEDALLAVFPENMRKYLHRVAR